MHGRANRHAPLAQQLTRLSANEMVSALGAGALPPLLRRGLALPLSALSRRLGATLAELDLSIDEVGLAAAAARALQSFGVTARASGEAVGAGPCLVLANHPGAYDALALMSAIGREDLAILAADRGFLRSLPRLSRQLLFVGDGAAPRAATLKRALTWLGRGGALLHFPAGQIEPDADFSPSGAALLATWQPGVAALVRATRRARGQVFVAGVRGVHSPRAKRLRLNRWAERRGVTTLSPLLQMVVRLADVTTRVHRIELGDQLAVAPVFEHEARLRGALLSAIQRA